MGASKRKLLARKYKLNPLTADHNATIRILETNGPGKDIGSLQMFF